MPYIREQFNVDNKTTSMIWAMMMFFQYSGSLIGTGGCTFDNLVLLRNNKYPQWIGNVLYRQYGPRVTLWLGGLLCGGGLILIAFVKSLWSFYLGIGIMVGLGFSFVILVGSATISRYFKTKRPMAIAFAMTGVPLMSIIFPLFYELVYNTYGLFGSIAIIGAVQLNVCVGGTFFRPIKLESDGAQLSASIFVKLKKAFGRLIR